MPKVRNFLTQLEFKDAIFDGCMYGLTASHGPNIGIRMKKPWRIACLNSCLPNSLNKLCSGDHPHTWCQGQDTVLTQQYTPEIAKIIVESVRLSVTRDARGGTCAYEVIKDDSSSAYVAYIVDVST